MNINCFQYNKLKKCKRFVIIGHDIVGYLNNNKSATVVHITENQFKQDHNKLVYGHKWSLTK